MWSVSAMPFVDMLYIIGLAMTVSAASSVPWWRGAAIYQIYPLSFLDSDGDGYGDLEGVIRGLDHVARLGVDAIWLSPFYCSAFVDWGYDTTDHCDVDPRFGSLADFDRLLARAHALGLKVIVDQVWTYTSHLHPWFVQSRTSRDNPKRDWYLWADAQPDGTEPNNWRALFGGPAWEWEPRRRQYYMTHFMPAMPHLNLHNPAVQEALLAIGRFWLDRGVDGFRLDVANYLFVDAQLRDNPPSGATDFTLPVFAQAMKYDGSLPETLQFIERVRALVREYGDAYLVAELSTDDAARDLRDYTLDGRRCHSAYAHALGAYVSGSLATALDETLPRWAVGDNWPTMFLSNHDIVRGVTRCFGDDAPSAAARVLLSVLAATRGNLHIYQGDELGLPHGEVPFERLRDPEGIRQGPRGQRRDGARVPFPWRHDAPAAGFSAVEPWLPVDARHRTLALDRQRYDDDSTLAHAVRVLALRRAEPALRLGSQRTLGLTGPLLGIERSHAGRTVRFIANLGDGTQHVAGKDIAGFDAPLLRCEGAALNAEGLHLPPYASAFLMQTTA
jgi:alpha-glucosidase